MILIEQVDVLFEREPHAILAKAVREHQLDHSPRQVCINASNLTHIHFRTRARILASQWHIYIYVYIIIITITKIFGSSMSKLVSIYVIYLQIDQSGCCV